MSRQRPYGDFEEAYINIILNNAPKELDDFILYLIYATNTDNKDYKNNKNFLLFSAAVDDSYGDVFFPVVLYCTEYLRILWLCLCRMYGEVCGDSVVPNSVFESYIPISNIKMALDDLRWYIDKLWPYYD